MIIVSFLIILALAALLLTNSSFVALPASIAQLWLLANAAPVASVNAELGFVPLLPAMGVIAVIAWRVYSVVKEKVSLADLTILIACILGVPLLLTLTALAMLLDASTVLPVAVPNVALASGRTLLVHSLAMIIGMGPRLWRALERRYGGGLSLFDTAVVALKYWGYFFATALVVLVVLLATHAKTVGELYQSMGGAGSAAGLTALNIVYLPNLLIAIVMVLAGGEFAIGDGSVSLFGSYLVPLPPLPILAAVPGSMWSYAWLFLLIPLVLAAFVEFRYLRGADRPFRDAGLIGAWSLVIALIVIAFATGRLGGYGVIGPVWWLALVTAPVWLWGVGLAIAGVGWVMDSRHDAELVDDIEDESEEVAEEETSEEVSEEAMEEETPEEQASEEEVEEEEASEGEAPEEDASEEEVEEETEQEEERNGKDDD
ncbi:cell division protein PerM [Corynebacterium sp. H130]|uniref:cell division protein PerM n=1 Tax=Corynebacterium sp. H130 TaxID=3133444 RepID=UPI0030ABC021